MFVSHKVLNGRHLMKDFCRRVSGRKRYLLVEYESQTGAEADFTAYGIPLAPVCNLRKARRKWARLTHVFSRDRADARTSVHIYLAVVQLVLLYGSETWMMTTRIGRVLG